ncbi:MAG: ABC transporter permease [Actinomycetia bacterium]|nr:ABC transporter permease [Actinomycetes bacterium]
MSRFQPRKLALALAAPVVAVIAGVVLTSLVLLVVGDPVMKVWGVIFSVPSPRIVVNILNSATLYYISAIAVAIGFRMNLFNIGVEGQYRIAAFAAAVFAGQAWLPGVLNIIVALIVAMCAGGLWAGIAAYLKVKRGISEVISTIMLNFLAVSVVAWLLTLAREENANSSRVHTKVIPESSQLEGLDIVPDGRGTVYTLIILAAAIGLAYWFVLNKTRFGFDLRATGASETAAVASGVDVKKMILMSMVLSGAVAGLVGMPMLFGNTPYAYSHAGIQPGLGFAGIAIALLGRNHAVGIAFAALLWSFLTWQGSGLQIQAGVAAELVQIIQGIILFAVVIAYEVTRRIEVRMEQTRVARELDAARDSDAAKEGASA